MLVGYQRWFLRKQTIVTRKFGRGVQRSQHACRTDDARGLRSQLLLHCNVHRWTHRVPRTPFKTVTKICCTKQYFVYMYVSMKNMQYFTIKSIFTSSVFSVLLIYLNFTQISHIHILENWENHTMCMHHLDHMLKLHEWIINCI